MIRTAITVIAAGLLLSACMTSGGGGERNLTELELRTIQTRSYDTTDSQVVMKAVLNSLQDLGYQVKAVDKDLGFLTAEKWTDLQRTKKQIRKAAEKDEPISTTQVLECTANVTVHGDACRVRLNFQQKLLGAGGGALTARVVDDAAFYQALFSRIGKAVFLQLEGI
ncbi:MAG: hypothetical protein GY851_14675 [bacterium]|nr:hypothetical protein [bacterium]